jgi:hypothetical protein
MGEVGIEEVSKQAFHVYTHKLDVKPSLSTTFSHIFFCMSWEKNKCGKYTLSGFG